MQLQRVDTTWHEIDRKQHKVIKDEDYDLLITEPSIIYCDNAPVAYYLPEGSYESKLNGESLRNALSGLNFPYAKKGRTSGISTQSHTFGWMPRRVIRHDFCHISAMAETKPILHKMLVDYGKEASALYEEYVPAVWKQHKETMENQIRKDFWISGLYTSGIVNKDLTLGGHVDGGNVRKTWNTQMTLKKDIEGGYLVLPELRIALEVADLSMTIFEAQNICHGVTPIHKTSVDSSRYSIVWYSMRDLAKCFDFQDELERIQKLKTQREWKRAGIS